MKKLYVSEQEWEAAARRYYKHLPGDIVYVIDWLSHTGYLGTVTTVYTTDQFNHEASPHQRYIVSLKCGRVEDVCDGEISTVQEWDDYIDKQKGMI